MLTPHNIYLPISRRCGIQKASTSRDRIAFTPSKGLPGVGFSRAEWNAIKDMKSGSVNRSVLDTTLPTGPLKRVIDYTAPFTLQNRETDYATVWAKLDALKQQ